MRCSAPHTTRRHRLAAGRLATYVQAVTKEEELKRAQEVRKASHTGCTATFLTSRLEIHGRIKASDASRLLGIRRRRDLAPTSSKFVMQLLAA